MLRPADPINNLPNDYSKQKILTELRQNDSAPDCLHQFLEHERPGAEEIVTRNSKLAFLDSQKPVTKSVSDLRTLEREIRPMLQSKPTTSQSTPDPSIPKQPSWETPLNISKHLPFYTSWFDSDTIHPIERQNLPEFFGEKPSKSPKIYLRIRNFLIQLYWRNPRSALHATTARRCVLLDAPSVIRVHTFLETWGLINLQSKNKTLNTETESAYDFVRPDEPFTAAQVNPTVRETPFETSLIEASFAQLGTVRPKCFQCQQSVHTTWASQQSPPKSPDEPNANGNSVTDNSHRLILCMNCFNQSNFPVFFSSKDFSVLSLPHLISQTLPIDSISHPSIESQQQLLAELSVSKLADLRLDTLQSSHPSIPLPYLLTIILQALSIRQLDKAVANGNHQLSSIRKRNELTAKMTVMLESLLDNVSSGSVDHTHRTKGREQTLKPLVQFNQEIGTAFFGKLERTTLRLAFLEDFEKILYQEKLNLKAFN